MNTKPTDPAEKDDRDGDVRADENAQVDMESEQSFPASDPPSWTLGPAKAGP